MRIRFAKIWPLLLILLVLLASLPVAAKTSVEITYPSAAETTIAAGRDFYVIGSIDTDLDDYSVTVELFAAGDTDTPLRSVHTDRLDDVKGMNDDYEALSYYGSDRSALQNSMMPDLVYDPAEAVSFRDAWRKCCAGNGMFTALICGGLYDGDCTLTAEDGTPYAPLAAGEYVIAVTVAGENEQLTEELAITLGVSPDKLCARFSPDAQFEAATAFAAENDLRTYSDPLPGYWQADALIPALDGSDIFCEILPKWHFAEYLEYREGTVHVVLYNISEKSTTNSVELGVLQDTQRVAAAKYYYYSDGEPGSEVRALSFGDRLQLVRATDGSAYSKDNFFAPAEKAANLTADGGSIDLTAADSTSIALFGVVTPLQNRAEEITAKADGSYSIANRITTVTYTIADSAGTELATLEKSVGLTRSFAADWQETSLYEFMHVLDLSPYAGAGDLTVTLAAQNSHGEAVEGTAETVKVTMAAAEEPAATTDSGLVRIVAYILCGLAVLIVLVIIIARLRRQK